ncbi:PP2C family protein-serine/threonine phosphatase [Tautonia plasticadhaerens]|uniref:Serine/threonine phosphatase stp n=1 Tax=Tautonia plasticadhaerens TaxID=2527974 RepID=A0A518GXV9_9BACT|nr:protein phosphatase 2C domain-containing protein [Tautonia plasticadhaerens]QDV33415.1 Serine/threonine phosphatase stp [Tautonia plasticadhaerens]
MNFHDPAVSETGDFPPVPRVPGPRILVSSAAGTDVGRVRKNNEDHFLVSRLRRVVEVESTNLDPFLIPPMHEEVGHLFAIADGMGGMASGEEASRLAISSGLELVRESARWHLDFSDPAEIDDLMTTCRRYIRQINRRVYEHASTNAAMEGMGTTLTVAYSVGLRLFVIHVGDSRIYLAHGGYLQQLTRDHTVAQDLATTGKITQAEVKSHRMRNVLTNYIGSPSDGIEAELHRLDLADGDRLLLCSDGLTDLVDDARISSILAGESAPQAACDRLIDSALRAGGRDNVTVIVAHYRVE